MEIQLYDTEKGLPAGKVEVPDEVLQSAKLVYDWLQQYNCIELHGLTLANDDI